MNQGILSSALVLLVINCRLQSICAYNAVDSYDTGASCYDCQYAPHDIHKEPRGPYVVNNYSGFHRCALEQEDDAFYVNKWTCQSERCFIRKDPNGQIFRGCADQWNLPWGVDTNMNCSQQGQSDAIWWFCDGHLCNDGFLHDSARCGDKAIEKEEPIPEAEQEAVAMPLYSAADQPDPEGGYYDYEQEVDPTPPTPYPTPVPYQAPTHRVEYPVGSQDSSYQETAEYVIDEETVHGIGFYDNFRDVEETMPMAPQAVYQDDPEPARPQFHHVNSQVNQDSGSYSDNRGAISVLPRTPEYQGYGDVRPPKHHPSVYDHGGDYQTRQYPLTPDYIPDTKNHGAATHSHPKDHGAAAHPHPKDHGATTHPHPKDHGAAAYPHPKDHGAAAHPHPKDYGAAVHPHPKDHGATHYPAPHVHPPAHPKGPQPVQAPKYGNEKNAGIYSVRPARAFIINRVDSLGGEVQKSHQQAFHGHGQVQVQKGKSQKAAHVNGGVDLPRHQEASYDHEATTAVKLPLFPHSHAGTARAKSATLDHGYTGKGQGKGQVRIIDHGGLLPRSGKQNNQGSKSGGKSGGVGGGRYGSHTDHNTEPFWMWWWHSGAFQRMNPQQAYVQYLYNRVMNGQPTKGTTYAAQDDDVKNPKSNAGYSVQQASYQRFPRGGRQRDYAPIRSNIYYSRITSKRRPRLPMPWAGGQKARKPVSKPHDHDVTPHEDMKGYEGHPTHISKTVDPLDYKSFKPLHTHVIREPLGPVADHPDPEPEGHEGYAAGHTEGAGTTMEVVLDEHVEGDGHDHGHGGGTGVTPKSLSKKAFYHYYDNLKLHQPTGRARGHVQSNDKYNPCVKDWNFKNPGALHKDPARVDRFIQCGPGTEHGQACKSCQPYYHICPEGTTFDDLQKVCNQGGSSTVEDKDYKTLDLYADYK